MISDKEAKMPIKDFLKSKVPEIDAEMEKYIPRKATKEWMENALGKTRFELDLEAYTKGVNESVWDLLDRGGKRFRPILTCIASEAVGGKWEDGLRLAPMVEIIHNGCTEESALVWMAGGEPKKIKNVKEGDYVVSVDKFGRVKERRVLHKHNNGVKKVLKVVSNNRTLRTTDEHPFLTVRKYQPIKFKIKIDAIGKLKQILSKKGKTISEMVDSVCAGTNFGIAPKALKNSLYGYDHCLFPEEFVDYLVEVQGLDWGKDFEKVQCKYEPAGIEFKWTRAKNLSKGDLLVVGKNVYGEGRLPEIPFFEKKPKDRYSVPLAMTRELAQLCGFIVGDGHIAKGKVELCIPENAEGRLEYEQIIERVFQAKPSKYKQSITCCSTALASLFDYLGLNKNHIEIMVPKWVFELPREHKLTFLRGYIDSDGHVNKRGQVCFNCANKELTSQMKMLFDSTGFVTGNIKERVVSNKHFPNAIKKATALFGFDVASTEKVSIEIGSEIPTYLERLGQGRVRTTTFRQKEKVPSLPEELSIEKLGFVEVREIIEDGRVQTYDIEVEETHSYIANGIVVHNTLMQDDVEDDSAARRGQPCTHHKFGVDTAVNTGTIMYFWPLIKITTNEFNLDDNTRSKIYDLHATELLRVCSGQAWDIAWHRGGFTPNEAKYLNMCLSKTGVLTKFALQLGVIAGKGTDEQYKVLGEYGQIIGIGFQIQDDILELTEEKFKEGKGSVGGDIHEGKRTLIVIRTLEEASPEDKKRLVKILDSHTTKEEEILEAVNIIKKYDGIEYSKKRAEELVLLAWEKADSVLEESNAKKVLKKFAEFLVERKI